MSEPAAEKSSLLKDAATVVPIVHLLTACFFIYAYCFGFGNRLVVFVTINDVFIVSLRVVGQIYLLVGVPILIANIIRAWRQRAWPTVIGCAVAALCAIGVMWSILHQAITPRPVINRAAEEVLSTLAIGLILLVFLVWIVERFTRAKAGSINRMNVMGTILAIFVLALAYGYNKGVTDRSRSYEESRDSYFECGTTHRAVIRPIGSHFLTLGANDQWALVDDQCEVKFQLPGGTAAVAVPVVAANQAGAAENGAAGH